MKDQMVQILTKIETLGIRKAHKKDKYLTIKTEQTQIQCRVSTPST